MQKKKLPIQAYIFLVFFAILLTFPIWGTLLNAVGYNFIYSDGVRVGQIVKIS